MPAVATTMRSRGVADQQLDPQRVDPGTVHLQTCLDAVDDVGADVEREVDRAVVVSLEQRAGVERDTVDRVACDATKGVGVDVASHERADVVGVGERRVVRDLHRERRELGFGLGSTGAVGSVGGVGRRSGPVAAGHRRGR